jgi:heme ABC exporter ATP-binding subunit CcmA
VSANDAVLTLEGVGKRFGAVAVLSGVNLQLGGGSFCLLLGHNGAGKSTLLRLVAGLARPTDGRVRVHGEDPYGSGEARRLLGVLSHQTLLYDDLTAAENLGFFARLYGLGDRREQVRAALERAGLSGRAHDRVRTFSRGMKQRLALARATLHGPAVLLLDEPFTGLDAAGITGLTTQLTELRQRGRAAVMVTHQLEPAAALADRVVVLRAGRVAGDVPWQGAGAAALTDLYAQLSAGRS